MKGFQKFTAIILTLILILGTVTYGYPIPEDVKDTKNQEAVTTLSALGILKGRDTGEFDPDGNITRAEFAAVAIRALGLESSVETMASEPTAFDDCGNVAWAWGYINLATEQGIIQGYGDRRFGPLDQVTYEQAVAILVRLLGYEESAQQRGGWIEGYLSIADEIKLTAEIEHTGSQPASRSTVAQLAFQALEIPFYNQQNQTLLSDKLKTTKKDIFVVSTDQAAIEGDKNRANEFSYREKLEDGTYDDILTIKTSDPDTTYYLGHSVKAYFKYDEKAEEYIVVLLWPQDEKPINAENLPYAYTTELKIESDGTVNLELLTQSGQVEQYPCNQQIRVGADYFMPSFLLSEEIANKVIQYQLDENGNINTILFARNNTTIGGYSDGLSFDYDGAAIYQDGYFDNQYLLTDQTIIFEAADFADVEDMYVMDKNTFETRYNHYIEKNIEHNIQIYDLDKENRISVLVHEPGAAIDYLAVRPAIINEINQSTINCIYGEESWDFTRRKITDTAILTQMSDVEIEREIFNRYGLDSTSTNKAKGKTYQQWFASYKIAYSFTPGDIILSSVNYQNQIYEMQKVYPLSNPELIQCDANGNLQLTPFSNYHSEQVLPLTVSGGIVTNITEDKITIDIGTSEPLTVRISDNKEIHFVAQNKFQMKKFKDIRLGDFMVVAYQIDGTTNYFVYQNNDPTENESEDDSSEEAPYSPVSIVAASRIATVQKPDGVIAQRVYGMQNGKPVQLLTKNDDVLADKHSLENIQAQVTGRTGLTADSQGTYEGATYEQWVKSYRAAYQYNPGSILLYTTNAKDNIKYAYKIFPAAHPDYIQWDNGNCRVKPYILYDNDFGMSSENCRTIITGTVGSLKNNVLTFESTQANSEDFPLRVALTETANIYSINIGGGEASIQNASLTQISQDDVVVIHIYDDDIKDIFIYKNFDLNRLFQ